MKIKKNRFNCSKFQFKAKLGFHKFLLGIFGTLLASSAVLAQPGTQINTQTQQNWDLKLEDVRIDKALKRWSKDAGYSFRWDADRYVLIAAPSVYEGSFLDAVRQVLETPGIMNSEYPLEACVYSNNPPLLRVTRLGDQVEECK